MARTKFRVSIFGISHRALRRSQVTAGSGDPLPIFFERVYLLKRGQVEHNLPMANLKLNPSPFTSHPTKHATKMLRRLGIKHFKFAVYKYECSRFSDENLPILVQFEAY